MKSALLLASLVALSAAAPLYGARHNPRVRAEPGVDSNVKQSPAEIRLWFKEPPELAVSSIKLADAAGKAYATGSVKATDDKTSIAAGVTTALPPGRYTVTWKTAGVDGHVIRGSFEFTVAT